MRKPNARVLADLASTRFRPVFILPVYVLPLRFGQAHCVCLPACQHRTFHGRILEVAVDERQSTQICAIEVGGYEENLLEQRRPHVGARKVSSCKVRTEEIIPTQI